MTFNILKSWDPHVHGTLSNLRSQYAPVATDEGRALPPEEIKLREGNRDRLRAQYHKFACGQFKTAADFDSFLDNQLKLNGYDIA